MKQLVGIVAMAILVGCSSGTEQKQTVSAGVLEYDSLCVPIDYPYLGFYNRSSIYQEGGNLYWAGYNHWLHSIDVFDLTNRCTVRSYGLEPEGQNAVLKNQIGSFLANDSLLVFRGFRNNVKVLSRKDGTLRKSFSLLAPEDNYQLHYHGGTDGDYSNGFNMRWKDGGIVMPLFTKQKQTMEDKLVMSVDLTTEETEIWPLSYPEEMKEELGRYGSLTFPFLTVAEDRLVYNFAYSSRVYVHKEESGKVEVLDMKSNATSNQSESKDANIKQRDFKAHFEYERVSLRFGEVYYDKVSDTYIRMHYDKREGMFDDQKSYLVIYRCGTGDMLEYEVPEGFSTRYFVSDGHAYFLLKNHDDVCLRFAVVDLFHFKKHYGQDACSYK